MSEHDDNPRGLRSVGRRLLSVFSRSDARKPAETPPNDPEIDARRGLWASLLRFVSQRETVVSNDVRSDVCKQDGKLEGAPSDSQKRKSSSELTPGSSASVATPPDGWQRSEDEETLAKEEIGTRSKDCFTW